MNQSRRQWTLNSLIKLIKSVATALKTADICIAAGQTSA